MTKRNKEKIKRNGKKEKGSKEEGKTRRELRRNEEGSKGIQKKSSAGERTKYTMMMMTMTMMTMMTNEHESNNAGNVLHYTIMQHCGAFA